ncbi:unnamed protein product [Cuscuta campestris]|uniref:Uncharacterized protein n=1 Tax=Cuscuta campestris TaxID=132261 RepID=A0A484NN65_9ASTE|nr:unnamed protein product [Cuscuta campestris]
MHRWWLKTSSVIAIGTHYAIVIWTICNIKRYGILKDKSSHITTYYIALFLHRSLDHFLRLDIIFFV